MGYDWKYFGVGARGDSLGTGTPSDLSVHRPPIAYLRAAYMLKSGVDFTGAAQGPVSVRPEGGLLLGWAQR